MILVTNAEQFSELSGDGKVKLLKGDYDLIDFDEAYNFVNNTLNMFIENYESYGGEPEIVHIQR